MNRQEFERQGNPRWREAEILLDGLDNIKAHNPEKSGRLPVVFRQLCSDLALAEQRMYGSQLCDRLNALVIRAHEHLYRTRGTGIDRFLKAVFTTFPRAVRKEAALFWLCTALFLVPCIAMAVLVNHDLRWADATLGPDGMADIQGMYGGDSDGDTEDYLKERHGGSNFMMFGFYIYNNIGIDFRIFAGGILAGIGTAFFLLYNGFHIGAVIGYVHHSCDPEQLYRFTAGHSALELIAMVIAGIAGMRLGIGVINPGRLSRGAAIREATRRALPLIVGAAVMTLLAAAVEGFWSAQPFPTNVKYTVGIVMWVLVIGYLALCGRNFSGKSEGGAP